MLRLPPYSVASTLTLALLPEDTPIDRLLIGLLLAIGLYAFDDLALSTILPSVAAELHGDALFGASFLAFLLSNLASLVAAGYAIDRIGVVRPFATALLLFAAGLALSVLAHSMPVFVVGRALQGLGGGGIQAVVSAVIVLAWHGPDRQRAISWATTSWMVPALVGPFLAGWASAALHWRYVFVALIALTLMTAVLVLPRLRRLQGPAREEGDDEQAEPLPSAVVMAAVGVACGTGVVLVGLDQRNLLGGLLAILGLFALRRPLAMSLPPRYWSAATPLAAALLLRMLACAVFFGIEAWLPWTVSRAGLASVLVAGLIQSTSAGGWTLATWWVDGALARVGPRAILTVASALLLAGSALAWAALTQLASIALAFVAWFVAGFAMGLCYPVIASLAMACAERGREGRLSMMMGLTDTLGITIAIGIGGALLRADRAGAVARVADLWLGYVGLALLLPLLLWRRREHFGPVPSTE